MANYTYLIPKKNRKNFNFKYIKNLLEEKFNEDYSIYFDKRLNFLGLKFKGSHNFLFDNLVLNIDECIILNPIFIEKEYQRYADGYINDWNYDYDSNEQMVEDFYLLKNENIPGDICLSFKLYEPKLFNPIIAYLYEYFECYIIHESTFPGFMYYPKHKFTDEQKTIYQKEAILIL